MCCASLLETVRENRGKEFIEYDNPFDVGMTGLLGFSSGYRAMMDCDTLLMLGTDFPYQQFYPEKATIIQVDIRGEQIGRRAKVDLGVVGDVKTTLQALLPDLTEKTDDQHLSASIQHYQKARAALDDLAVGEIGQKSIHPQYVAKVINELAWKDAIFTWRLVHYAWPCGVRQCRGTQGPLCQLLRCHHLLLVLRQQ
jgi:pyruvate dehydrogenase (quinone)